MCNRCAVYAGSETIRNFPPEFRRRGAMGSAADDRVVLKLREMNPYMATRVFSRAAALATRSGLCLCSADGL